MVKLVHLQLCRRTEVSLLIILGTDNFLNRVYVEATPTRKVKELHFLQERKLGKFLFVCL